MLYLQCALFGHIEAIRNRDHRMHVFTFQLKPTQFRSFHFYSLEKFADCIDRSEKKVCTIAWLLSISFIANNAREK